MKVDFEIRIKSNLWLYLFSVSSQLMSSIAAASYKKSSLRRSIAPTSFKLKPFFGSPWYLSLAQRQCLGHDFAVMVPFLWS